MVIWIVTGAVFIAVILACKAIFGMVSQSYKLQRLTARRLSEHTDAEIPAGPSLRRSRVFAEPAYLRPVLDLITQSGVKLDLKITLLCSFIFGAALFFLWASLIGYNAVSGLAAVVSVIALAYGFLSVARQKRIAKFAEQIPDAIDVLVRGVRVGYPLPVALALVAREMPDPIGKEFGLTAEEISFGQDFSAAIDSLYRRVGQEDLQFLAVALNVQNQTGGNLAEILQRLSKLIRIRAKLYLKIRSLSAEGRMSARFLSLMPFVLFGIVSIISPAYFDEVRHSDFIGPALFYSSISLLLGNMVMYKMINFKY